MTILIIIIEIIIIVGIIVIIITLRLKHRHVMCSNARSLSLRIRCTCTCCFRDAKNFYHLVSWQVVSTFTSNLTSHHSPSHTHPLSLTHSCVPCDAWRSCHLWFQHPLFADIVNLATDVTELRINYHFWYCRTRIIFGVILIDSGFPSLLWVGLWQFLTRRLVHIL